MVEFHPSNERTGGHPTLYPRGAERGISLILTAYIDESSSDERVPEFFTLSCLVAEMSAWFWFELDWKQCLDEKNAQLKKLGRRTISRYHAADCSSRVNEFSGWGVEEQIAFTQSLFTVFQTHITNTIGYTINLRELAEEITDSAKDPKRHAYALLLRYLMIEIGNNILAREKDQLVSIIHDRSQYDVVLLESFNAMVDDPTFRYRNRFTSINPMSWEQCIPLQPADLLAYENFKEASRESKRRHRRKSLQALLDLSTFGGTSKFIPRDGIREIKGMLESSRLTSTSEDK